MDVAMIRKEYERYGLVYLRSAFSPRVAAELADRVHATGNLAELRRADTFAPIATTTVRDAISGVLGEDSPAPDDWGGALVTEATPGTWRTPATGWHLDYPVRGAPLVDLRLKWFAYLEPVGHAGGATVVVAGSHRLVADWAALADDTDVGRSASVRNAIFGTSPWFAVLRDVVAPNREAKLASGAIVRGAEIRVVELTGAPGDVVLVHPHLLHAASANNSTRTRLMVTGGLEVLRGSSIARPANGS